MLARRGSPKVFTTRRVPRWRGLGIAARSVEKAELGARHAVAAITADAPSPVACSAEGGALCHRWWATQHRPSAWRRVSRSRLDWSGRGATVEAATVRLAVTGRV